MLNLRRDSRADGYGEAAYVSRLSPGQSHKGTSLNFAKFTDCESIARSGPDWLRRRVLPLLDNL